jgi:hypothetical protein
MNRSTVGLLLLGTSLVSAPFADDLGLEPCINGGVSASGTHVDQASEDLARAIEAITAEDEYALEPCINGGVSADGTEPAHEGVADSRVLAVSGASE